MQTLGCVDIDDYIRLVKTIPEIGTECKRLLTVPITRFWRDKKLWEIFGSEVLPEIATERAGPFRVWSAGCSGGEEAYTFAIIWSCLAATSIKLPELEIVATDINPECLFRAKRGLYTVSSLKEVPEEIRQTFFIKRGKRFQVIPDLKKSISWEEDDFFESLPDVEFDIIFLRNNLLTYYHEPDKSEGFQRVASCLKKSGLLVIGAHEFLPEAVTGFIRSESHPLLFRAIGNRS